MRIAKATLASRWAWSTGLALTAFAILAALDFQLKTQTGVGTADLSSFASAAQFRAAFWAWGPQPYAMRAGFNLGFDYLLMPLYAASFFYSGILTAEAYAPKPGRLRRIILMAAMVPPVGALCDAGENALHLQMLLHGADESLARLAVAASSAKKVALIIGLGLLAGTVIARFTKARGLKTEL